MITKQSVDLYYYVSFARKWTQKITCDYVCEYWFENIMRPRSRFAY